MTPITQPKEDTASPLPEEHVATDGLTLMTFIAPRRIAKKSAIVDDDEPLVDRTAALPLHSKRTERKQKKQQERLKRTTVESETKSFLELPPELLIQVICHLLPSDILSLMQLSRSSSTFIQENAAHIGREVIRKRFWTLARCFPLPVRIEEVDEAARSAILCAAWQEKLQIHKKPYQHVQPPDPQRICSCMTCLLAWNNLCVILDLAHFQYHLDNRKPIPMIPRGTHPKWNTDLVKANAKHVEDAIGSPLKYARILEKHLNSIFATLMRQVRGKTKTVHPRRLFHLSEDDLKGHSDAFLERSGPPSYEFPYHRDNYYSIEAYVPNRKWSKEDNEWKYYQPGKAHKNDLAWVVARFKPQPTS